MCARDRKVGERERGETGREHSGEVPHIGTSLIARRFRFEARQPSSQARAMVLSRLERLFADHEPTRLRARSTGPRPRRDLGRQFKGHAAPKAVPPAAPAAERPPCHTDPDVQKCARCRFLSFRQKWISSHGSFTTATLSRRGHQTRTQWLVERPARLAGPWALGCSVCAHMLHRLSAGSESGNYNAVRTKIRRFCTKWSRFEVRGIKSMQPSTFLKHAQSDMHKRAVRWHMEPDLPLKLLVPTYEDAQLFRGAVPQLPDWLRVWRAARSGVSFHALEALQGTEAFLEAARRPAGTEWQPRAVARKAAARMVNIMAAVVAEQRLEILQDATCISLATDDRGDYRIVRYQCDAQDSCPRPPHASVRARGGGGSAVLEVAVFPCRSLSVVSVSPPRRMGSVIGGKAQRGGSGVAAEQARRRQSLGFGGTVSITGQHRRWPAPGLPLGHPGVHFAIHGGRDPRRFEQRLQ